MTQTIRLSAGETAIIYRRNLSSVPMTIRFDAVAVNGDQPLGEVEIRGSYWVFPKAALTQPLQLQNSVSAGFWDTFFAIAVTAHTDIALTLPGRSHRVGSLWLGAAIAIVVIAAIVMIWLT